jgi:hypothetical protein
MEQWIALAEKSGLEGAELLKFVEKCSAEEEARQKRVADREERAAEREFRKMEMERQIKAEAHAQAMEVQKEQHDQAMA